MNAIEVIFLIDGLPVVFADWFKGGKGKDPNLIALDNDMDNYFKGKAAAAEAPATA